MRMKARSHTRNTGFTLVEILVALTLFSLVLVMVFNGLYSAGLSWQKGEDQSDINDTQRLELAFLRRQLSEAVPLIRIDGIENPVLFKGGRDFIRFVSGLPAHRGGGGLDVLNVQIEQHGSEKDLVLAYRPVMVETDFFDDGAQEDWDRQVLLTDIDRVEFDYYGNRNIKDAPAWYDNWESTDRLPEAVRIQITSSNPRQYWPEMVIPVYTQVIKGQPQFTMDTRKLAGGNR